MTDPRTSSTTLHEVPGPSPGAWHAPRVRPCAGVLAAVLVLGALSISSPTRAGVADARGSIGFGYSKLFTSGSPSGSLSTSAGLSYPVSASLSIGPSMAFHLLGSNTVERGSQLATVDYSVFEAGLFAHWKPSGWGPVARVSVGPELVSARAEISSTVGGASFSDLAVQEAAPGAGLGVMLMKTRESPVRVGLELSGLWAFLPNKTWFISSARLAFHY